MGSIACAWAWVCPRPVADKPRLTDKHWDPSVSGCCAPSPQTINALKGRVSELQWSLTDQEVQLKRLESEKQELGEQLELRHRCEWMALRAPGAQSCPPGCRRGWCPDLGAPSQNMHDWQPAGALRPGWRS